MILGYTLTTFPKSSIQTKTTKRTSTELRAVKEEGLCTPNTSCTSVHTNSQSPAAHSQSTLHVQTPTLNINTPPFPSNLHQAPLPPHAQNSTNNYHTNQQQVHTPPTQPFNAQ